jgi:hypothetical protein
MIMLGVTYYFPVIVAYEMRDHSLCNQGYFI